MYFKMHGILWLCQTAGNLMRKNNRSANQDADKLSKITPRRSDGSKIWSEVHQLPDTRQDAEKSMELKNLSQNIRQKRSYVHVCGKRDYFEKAGPVIAKRMPREVIKRWSDISGVMRRGEKKTVLSQSPVSIREQFLAGWGLSDIL